MNSSAVNTPPWFDGENYLDWRIMMKAFLYAQDDYCWYVIEKGWTHPTKTKGKGVEGSEPQVVEKPHEE